MLYGVDFIDRKDGQPNRKLFEANSMLEIVDHMETLGHRIMAITEVEPPSPDELKIRRQLRAEKTAKKREIQRLSQGV